MKITFFKKRLIPWPTLTGWVCLFAVAASPAVWWCLRGESFLCLTERLPANALIVEGWIGIDGVRAAKGEFETGRYQYIVTTGGLTDNPWTPKQWNYASEAAKLIVSLGVSADHVIEADAPETGIRRTFESAIAVRRVLEEKGLHPGGVNVFTLGAHARRSRLVFAEAFSFSTNVGVISWSPPGYRSKSWWKSSERSLDLIKETIGYIAEPLLHFVAGPVSIKRRPLG